MDLSDVKKLVDILYYEGQMVGYKVLINENPEQFGTKEEAAFAQSSAITQTAILLLQQSIHSDDEWNEIMLHVIAKALEAKNSVKLSDPSPDIKETDKWMREEFDKIKPTVLRKKYKVAAELMQSVAKWMIATKDYSVVKIKENIQVNLATMRRLLSEVQTQGTAIDSPAVRSIDLYLSVHELHTIVDELNNKYRFLHEQFRSDSHSSDEQTTEELTRMLAEITAFKTKLEISHDLREIKEPKVLKAIDESARKRMSTYLEDQVDQLIEMIQPNPQYKQEEKLQDIESILELRDKIRSCMKKERQLTVELIEKNAMLAAQYYGKTRSIYHTALWLQEKTKVHIKEFFQFSQELVREWKESNGENFHVDIPQPIGAIVTHIAPSAVSVAAPQEGVDHPILTDGGLREKLDTETFPDDHVTADLLVFAALENQPLPLSNARMRIHKETEDLLNQMKTFGSHPLFNFIHHPHDMFEIQLLRGSNLMYKKPIEIAKIIYGLMQHQETKQIKYPAEMGIGAPQTAALVSLLADINGNFKVLQRELDELKPKTLKRIVNRVYNAQARKVTQSAKSIQSDFGDVHLQRVNQLTQKVAEVLTAKKTYKEHPKKHNFNIVEDRANELKTLMRQIKREPHSEAEMKMYQDIVAPAQKWNIPTHLFRTVRHAIWDGGKRTRRLRKKK
jgi:hypothetical protein